MSVTKMICESCSFINHTDGKYCFDCHPRKIEEKAKTVIKDLNKWKIGDYEYVCPWCGSTQKNPYKKCSQCWSVVHMRAH